MGLFSRKKKPLREVWASNKTTHAQRSDNERHLSEFASSREGVRAYFEQATAREAAALVLIAVDGEWTRRKIADISAAEDLADSLGIPLFDVAASGYPREMREWNVRHARK
ncbi:MAG: oxidoreductase [Actinomycetaceae bacterium]|nr:oxidoreductase [Arcanobacterium sp.]MDD7505410.1 oxidoreductase [Actinomycetaceae bacterium]MDY6143547.1 oxidoreductase [Arcanobacterium sp.]